MCFVYIYIFKKSRLFSESLLGLFQGFSCLFYGFLWFSHGFLGGKSKDPSGEADAVEAGGDGAKEGPGEFCFVWYRVFVGWFWFLFGFCNDLVLLKLFFVCFWALLLDGFGF